MKKLRMSAAIIVVSAVSGGLWFYKRADASEVTSYRTATVARTDIKSTVAATGSLGAVTTVQVGTQASGQISAIYVDFNDRVKKGQLLARIDPTLQQQAVADAQAGVERSNAQFEAAKRDYDRNKQLFDSQFITASEFGSIESGYLVAQANLKSAQVALDRARQNLSYTSIYAPIDGVVVERNVDVGQTVASSLSAPQLFLIAQDLTEMQILASVDESDIGLIAEGQPVSFSVTAYRDQQFAGAVQQVRLQSASTDNVVNYTVVVRLKNPEGKLLPGMTATVRFETATATNVLSVPNAALRFQPPAAVIEKLQATAQQEVATSGSQGGDTARRGSAIARGTATSTAAAGGPAAGGPAAGGPAAGAPAAGTRGARAARGTQRGAAVATIWTLDATGALAPVRVRTGLSDGQRTQVTTAELEEGAEVVVGTATANAGAPAAAANPFQGGSSSGSRRPGAF